jgi:glycosyltransferase involved in cell wall biosynthesis
MSLRQPGGADSTNINAVINKNLNNITFSIVIPVFNGPEYLRQCLKSIQEQTFIFFEVIVVDDGSSEDVTPIVGFYSKFLVVKYIRISNSGGPARPRNVGVEAASGRWIAFVDADDIWFSGKLASVAKYIEKCNESTDVVFHKLTLFSAKNGAVPVFGRRIGRRLRKDAFVDLMCRGNAIPMSAAVVRHSVFAEGIRFREEKIIRSVEDFDLWLNLAARGYRFGFISKSLGGYRVHPGGISRNRLEAIKKNLFLLRKYRRILSIEYAARSKSQIRYFIGSNLYHCDQYKKAFIYLISASELASFNQRAKRVVKIALTALKIISRALNERVT